MLTQICQTLRNWFDRSQPKINGQITIESGRIQQNEFLQKIQNNQYFRIIGSVFNDGVYQYTEGLELVDEVFEGSIWLMAIPQAFLDLVEEITAWQEKNGAVDAAAMSPFTSESFGGYSYSKGTGETGGSTWQAVYAARLNAWRKI